MSQLTEVSLMRRVRVWSRYAAPCGASGPAPWNGEPIGKLCAPGSQIAWPCRWPGTPVAAYDIDARRGPVARSAPLYPLGPLQVSVARRGFLGNPRERRAARQDVQS
jgi:hypothetical protein